MKLAILLCASLALVAATGCHSAYVEATVHNGTDAPVSLLEVDYPSASFGKETLGPGRDFHYRFKILGNGATKVIWTDAARHEHTVPGPALNEGQEGKLLVTITPGSALWTTELKPR